MSIFLLFSDGNSVPPGSPDTIASQNSPLGSQSLEWPRATVSEGCLKGNKWLDQGTFLSPRSFQGVSLLLTLSLSLCPHNGGQGAEAGVGHRVQGRTHLLVLAALCVDSALEDSFLSCQRFHLIPDPPLYPSLVPFFSQFSLRQSRRGMVLCISSTLTAPPLPDETSLLQDRQMNGSGK